MTELLRYIGLLLQSIFPPQPAPRPAPVPPAPPVPVPLPGPGPVIWPPAPPAPAPSPAPAPPVTTDTRPVEVLTLMNRDRQAAGLPPLRWQDRLGQAAQRFAEVMASRDTLSHTADGTTMQQRVAALNYSWSDLGENILEGADTPARAESLWMQSPPHRANILRSTFVEAGVGLAHGASGMYWCVDFGRQAMGLSEEGNPLLIGQRATLVWLSGPLQSSDHSGRK